MSALQPDAPSAAATSEHPKRPKDRAIAFAISVVLSKPEDVSVRGKYLL